MPHRLLIYFVLLWVILYRLPRFIPTPPLVDRCCNQMRTGDLLLYSGRSLDSALIRAWTGGTFTHIGMVWIDPATQDRYCWNSDKRSSVPCILRQECCDGPQLQLLSAKLEAASGCMYHVPWNERRYRRPQLTRAYMNQVGGGFRDSVVVMAVAALPELVPNVATGPSRDLLCTELVAKTIFELAGYYVARRTRPDTFLALPLVRRDLISLV
jgi:hypothetical protein